MKAILIQEFGDPEVLRWEEVPTPTPGPGEVLVRVHAVSVNRTLDLQVRQDGGNYGVVLPLVLGTDPSGVVVAVGPGVEQPRVHDRVTLFRGIRCGTCTPCLAGNEPQCRQPRMLGVHCWGGYAEYLCVPASNCIPIPNDLPFPEATVITRHFPLAFVEAHIAGLKAGDWVLVMGAAGGLGSCIIQVAKTFGAHIIAGAGSDERVAVGRDLGAQFDINYRRQEVEQEVKRITQGHGVDVVFENIGDPSLWSSIFNSLARGGRLVTVGAHGGGFVTLDVKRLYQYRLQVLSGLGVERREDLDRALQLAVTGKFRVLIDRVMPLYEAAAAHRLVAQNATLGKIV
ncbi:zinc-binding dehydrogenase, partial [Candidatus Entotheonella palauensis]|uniref:zinc-binding dehydrogenase n=1 Tax=Candidatus Entotheonella palauensis TaxID=93172 RepID=UPI000B7F32AB